MTSLPFLVRNAQELDKVWPIIDKFTAPLFAKAGVKNLFYHTWPMQNVFGKGKPIRTIEDFKGRKIRSTDGKQAEMLKQLGASSVNLTTAEVPVAMERGVAEGFITAGFNVVGAKWYEFVQWGWLGDIHIGGPDYTLVNIAAYEKLDADTRAKLDAVAKDYAPRFRAANLGDEAKDLEILKTQHKVDLFVPPKEQIDALTAKMTALLGAVGGLAGRQRHGDAQGDPGRARQVTADSVVQPSPRDSAADAARSTAWSGALPGPAACSRPSPIVAILVIVCVETVLRQFQSSLLVTDEIAGYLNAAAIFLGLAWTLREGGFIRVEMLYDRAMGAPQAGAALADRADGDRLHRDPALGLHRARSIYAFDRDTRAVSIIDTPEWIPQSVMVLGLAVLLLQLLAWIVDRVRNIP